METEIISSPLTKEGYVVLPRFPRQRLRGFELSDFIPVVGMLRYIERVEGTIPDFREEFLMAYNALFLVPAGYAIGSGIAVGLEKLL